jgi:acetyl esterase/lipase
VPTSWSETQKTESSIPARDGTALRALVYKSDSAEKGALLVYFHGGGWTFGFPEAGEGYFEALVKERGCTVVSVGYRVAPEERFPRAVEDAWDALKWVCVVFRSPWQYGWNI